MRKCDRTTTVKMKRHADIEWYVKPSIIKERDKALGNDESKKKSDTPYNTTLSIEFGKKGSMVTAEAQNATQVTRNNSFFKTVPIVDSQLCDPSMVVFPLSSSYLFSTSGFRTPCHLNIKFFWPVQFFNGFSFIDLKRSPYHKLLIDILARNYLDDEKLFCYL